MVITMNMSKAPWVKTETAADYIWRHARSPLIRAHAADVQRAIAACRTADNAMDAAAALVELLTAVRECAGSNWLSANSDDPDVARFTMLLDWAAEPTPAGGAPDVGDIDELLATVLWAAHGPPPTAP
jgi:hypothetical protein